MVHNIIKREGWLKRIVYMPFKIMHEELGPKSMPQTKCYLDELKVCPHMKHIITLKQR
jgi:hypothetical protein